MGLDVEVYLINSNRYREELLPAYNSFFERGETKSLANLLPTQGCRNDMKAC
jgi:hypothetical protein